MIENIPDIIIYIGGLAAICTAPTVLASASAKLAIYMIIAGIFSIILIIPYL